MEKHPAGWGPKVDPKVQDNASHPSLLPHMDRVGGIADRPEDSVYLVEDNDVAAVHLVPELAATRPVAEWDASGHILVYEYLGNL